MDPKALSSVEVLDLFRDLSQQRSALVVQAATMRPGKARNAKWAAAGDVKEKQEIYYLELLARLGCDVPAEVKARPGLVAIASRKAGKLCDECKSSGGFHAKLLSFWIPEEWIPLPLMLAYQGASKEAVLDAIEHSALLCPRCAVKVSKGDAKFTRSGKPCLAAYKAPR